jgi:hypothetical protein
VRSPSPLRNARGEADAETEYTRIYGIQYGSLCIESNHLFNSTFVELIRVHMTTCVDMGAEKDVNPNWRSALGLATMPTLIEFYPNGRARGPTVGKHI